MSGILDLAVFICDLVSAVFGRQPAKTVANELAEERPVWLKENLAAEGADSTTLVNGVERRPSQPTQE